MFLQTHNGRSTDDVVIDDNLNRKFINAVKNKLPSIGESKINWLLLNLRKSSNLDGTVKSL
jgi:hypothetical protein